MPGDHLLDSERYEGARLMSRMRVALLAAVAAVAVIVLVVIAFVVLSPRGAGTARTSAGATNGVAPVAVGAGAGADASSSASAPATAPLVDLAAMTQPDRRAFVLKLISQGVFTGVQATTSPPKVGVTPLFQALNPDFKQQFIAAVDAYVHNGAPTTEALQIIDATSGNLIGTYTVADGLKLTSP